MRGGNSRPNRRRHWPRSWVIALLSALLSQPAEALERCESYVSTTVTPKSFSTATAPLSKLPPKSEFESTADYNLRVAGALSADSSATLIISRAARQTYIEYDADRQQLRISMRAFGRHLDAFGIFISSPYWSQLSPSPNENFDVVVSDPTTLVSSYDATNAFGVRTRVKKFHLVTSAIYDHAGTGDRADLFPSATEQNGFFVGEIPMTATQAKLLKPVISLAFVVVPKWPFWYSGSRIAASPTLDNPQQISERYSVLIADIQCGLVLDGAGKVLASYPTR